MTEGRRTHPDINSTFNRLGTRIDECVLKSSLSRNSTSNQVQAHLHGIMNHNFCDANSCNEENNNGGEPREDTSSLEALLRQDKNAR